MSVATVHLSRNHGSMLVNTCDRNFAWLTWEHGSNGALFNFKVHCFVPSGTTLVHSTQTHYFFSVPYMVDHSSEINVLHEVAVIALKSMPECSQVFGASLGHDMMLAVLVNERVKVTGKKWSVFRRYVYVVSAKH